MPKPRTIPKLDLQKQYPTHIRMKAQIHDSALQQLLRIPSDKDSTHITTQDILTRMDNPVIIHSRTLSIPVDYKIGISWGSMVEYKR